MSAPQRTKPIPRAGAWEPAEAYDVAAPGYDTWHWQKIWRAAESQFVEATLRAQPRPRRILDVGCGTGTLLGRIHQAKLAEAELVGIDISRGMLARAHAKFGGTPIAFLHGDFLDLPFGAQVFEVIFMCRVASHMADLRPCFQKAASLMRDGGTFVFSDVYSGHPYECTRLPFPEGKIPVVTYKHRLPDIVKVAYESSLIVTAVQSCSVDGLPRDLKTDPDLPRTLSDQLENGLTVPFGCLLRFSLRTSPSKALDSKT